MSDTSPFGFGRFVPGFDFLQNLAKNASEGSSKIPGLSNWIAPTMSVEDIEKRVDELKAVQFWLEQNSRALTATIQALEVQKMTLSTLKGMNVSMGDMSALFQPKSASTDKASAASTNPADAFAGVTQAMTDAMVRATSAFAPQSGGAADKTPSPAAAAAKQPEASDKVLGTSVDPMQWWGALTQQFQQIATNAMQDVGQQAAMEKAAGMTQDAFKTATDMASQMVPTAKAKSESAKKKPAASTEKAAGAAGKDPADNDAPAAKKAPARGAAAPSKRARG